MSSPRTVVLIPTYNELETLPGVVAEVRQAAPDLDVLVIDDNSPDGTGALADDLAAADPQVRVLHRAGKEGLGAAYLAGMRQAMAQGYDAVIEMDADGSHPAAVLPTMLAAASDADLVIGSRYVAGGGTEGWAPHRMALSRGANIYSRLMLGIPVYDMTAGYRLYRSDLLQRLPLDEVTSAGYCFQIDMTRLAADAGARITEVPITFVERRAGESKMSGGIVGEALFKVAGWGVGRRAAQAKDWWEGIRS